MKASIAVLAASTVAFAGSSIYLWHELGETRDRASEVEAASAKLTARIEDLEKARAEFARHRFSGGEPGGPMLAQRIVSPPPTPDAADHKPDHVEAAVVNGPRPDRLPAFQKMMRAQIRSNNKRIYADVGESLGLTADQASKLIDLITEQQARSFEASRSFDEANRDPATMQRSLEDMRQQQQIEITDLIGADKAQQLQKYQETLPARAQVDMIARQLDGVDAPLNEDQRKRLTAVVVDEAQRIPMPEYTEGMDQAEYAKQYAAWQSDYNERVASEARGILSGDQYNAFNDYQQWQKEMRDQFAAANPGTMPRQFRRMGGQNTMFSTVTMPAAGAVEPAPNNSRTKKPQ